MDANSPGELPDDPRELAQIVANERARVARLERVLARQRGQSRELEQMLEDKTRELFTTLERVKLLARASRAQTAAAIVAESASLEVAAPKVLRELCHSMGWNLAALWLVDSRAMVLRCADVWMAPTTNAPHFEALTRRITFAPGIGLPGRTWASRSPAWIADVVHDANFPRIATATAEGLHGGCAFPICVASEVVGVVELLSSELREPDEELLGTLEAIGARIGQTLEYKRVQQALREQDLVLARRVQTSILPRDTKVVGLELAARMHPAEEVGGDYYDVLPCDDGCWLGIGDVTGHGVGAGLIMMMLQSAVSAVVRADRAASPRDHLHVLNAVLFDNIRRRLTQDDHVTFSLVRFRRDGSVVFAGAHEDIIVWRAATRTCECIATHGPWLGAVPRLEHVVTESSLTLQRGDILLLYTDGITEAMSASREQFGLERLTAQLAELAGAPTERICDGILAAAQTWTPVQHDDMTVLAARYVGDDVG